MKKLIVLLFITTNLFAQEGVLPISGLGNKGLCDKYDSNIITNEYSPDLQNVWLDKGAMCSREGYAQYLQTLLTGQQEVRSMGKLTKLDGSEYMLVSSSNSIFYFMGGYDWSILVSGLNENYDYTFTNVLDYIFMQNGYDTPRKWNGTTLSTSTIPIAKYMWFSKGILFEAGIPNNENLVTWSNQWDLSQSITDIETSISTSTGYNYLFIEPFAGDYITGGYAMEDGIIVTRKYSTWKLKFNSHTDVTLYCIDPHIGCLYGGTIAYDKGTLKWQSHRGIEECDGNSIRPIPISDPIDTTIKNMRQLVANQREWALTTTADFNTGTSTNVNITNNQIQVNRMEEKNDAVSIAQIPLYNGSTYYQTFYSTKSYAQKLNNIQITLDQNVSLPISNNVNIHLRDNSGNVIEYGSTQTVTQTVVGNFWVTFPFTTTIQPNTTYQIRVWVEDDEEYSWRATMNSYSNGTFITNGFDNLSDTKFRVIFERPIFTSPIKYAGADWVGWGVFEENDNGNVIYEVRTATLEATMTNYSWTPIINGQVISSTIGAYIQWRSSFTVNNTSIDDVKFKWYDNGTYQPPFALGWDNRYWYFCSEDNEYNDTVLIYDQNGNWTRFKGIYAYSGLVYRTNILFLGDSLDRGSIFQFGVGYDDDGSSITAYYQTKDYDLGYPDQQKVLNDLRVTADYESGGSLDINYTIDLSTTYSLGSIPLDETSGIINHKANFPDTQNKGKYVNFKIQQISPTKKFKFYGMNLRFEPQDLE